MYPNSKYETTEDMVNYIIQNGTRYLMKRVS